MQKRRCAAAALLVVVIAPACRGAESTEARDRCERTAGVGNCFKRSGKWYPRGAIVGATTTSSSTTVVTTTTTTTTVVAAPPPPTSPPAPTDTPSAVVMTDRGEVGGGRTPTFTVIGNWYVSYGYSNGTTRQFTPSCSIRGTIKRSDNSQSAGLPDFSDSGRGGRGQQDYQASGTFFIQISFDCPPEAYEYGQPSWNVKTVD